MPRGSGTLPGALSVAGVLCLVLVVTTAGCNMVIPEQSGSASPTPDGTPPAGECTAAGVATFPTAQTPPTPTGSSNLAWFRSIRETGFSEAALAVVPAHDSGYVVTGTSGRDMWLLAVTEAGETAWTRRIGGRGRDTGHGIARTDDGGYVVVGTTESYAGEGADTWLVKVNTTGQVVWNRTLGPESSGGHAVEQTDDDGFIVSGKDGTVTKVDGRGILEWTIEGPTSGVFTGVTQTTDGGFAVAGHQSGFAGGDSIVMKVDETGTREWCRTLGEKRVEEQLPNDSTATPLEIETGGRITDIVATHDGGVAVTGSRSLGRGIGLWTFGEAGRVELARTYNRGKEGQGTGILQTRDGGFVIAGTQTADVMVIKVDVDGTKQWTAYHVDAISETTGVTRARGDYVVVGATRDGGFAARVTAPSRASTGTPPPTADEPRSHRIQDWMETTAAEKGVKIRITSNHSEEGPTVARGVLRSAAQTESQRHREVAIVADTYVHAVVNRTYSARRLSIHVEDTHDQPVATYHIDRQWVRSYHRREIDRETFLDRIFQTDRSPGHTPTGE